MRPARPVVGLPGLGRPAQDGPHRRRLILLAVPAFPVFLAAATAGSVPAEAQEEMPTFRIEMKDGAIVPDRLEVPANARFKILIANTGTTPVEFESLELKREKAVAPGDEVPLVFRRLDPGSYEFFDDFHPGTKATLIAK